MKKVLSILAIVAFVATISTSCKKDCTCKEKTSGTVISVTPDLKKSECDDLNTAAQVVGVECKQ